MWVMTMTKVRAPIPWHSAAVAQARWASHGATSLKCLAIRPPNLPSSVRALKRSSVGATVGPSQDPVRNQAQGLHKATARLVCRSAQSASPRRLLPWRRTPPREPSTLPHQPCSWSKATRSLLRLKTQSGPHILAFFVNDGHEVRSSMRFLAVSQSMNRALPCWTRHLPAQGAGRAQPRAEAVRPMPWEQAPGRLRAP